MKKFTQKFHSHTLSYVFFACLIAAVAFFAILPLMPDIEQNAQGPSLTAGLVAAFGGDGGGDGGGGGDAGDGCCGDSGDTGEPSGPSDPPSDTSIVTTCSISSTPSTISAGQSTTLSWIATNATSVSINNGVGTVGANGSLVVSPTLATDYVLTAIGPNGQAACSTFVTVIPPTAVCTMTATRGSITAGESVTLNWNTSNAYRVIIDNGVGSVEASGSRTVSPTVTTTYTLTAYDGLGINVVCVCTITIEVVPVPPAAPTCTLTATPASITRGGSATLTWSTTNATSVSINNGVGVVTASSARTVSPTNTTTYTLTAVGSDRNVDCLATVTVTEPPAPLPTCALTANPKNITAGQSSTLTWSTTNATSVSINQSIGSVNASGAQFISPLQSTTYTLTAIGAGGTVTCTDTITVTNTPPPAPTCTLTANPGTINPGQSSTLTWSTTQVASTSINQSIGSVSTQGSRSVSPTTSTTYTLTAIGDNGQTITCVTTVIVETPPTPQPVRCDAFSASPSTLTSAGTATLTWVTTNATSVSINNGVGVVTATGTRAVNLSTTTTYILTAQGESGPIHCQTTVTVAPVAVVPTCDAFSVNPTRVSRGATATLNWNTTNATAVSINNGVGNVTVDGSQNVTVSDTTTYTLTATNGSATDTCQTTVTVESSGGGGGGSSAPRCTLTASKKSITAGDAVTLTWKNTRTNDILLKDSTGKTLADSKKDSSIDEDADSIVVRPTQSTSYTLKVIRGTRTRECTVDINVTSGVTLTSTRTHTPLVANISLASVPYTGFDAGPALTFLFYGLLIVWGLVAAYLLVIKRGPVFGYNASNSAQSKRPVIREHLIQGPPAPDSDIVREQIFGSVYVPPTRAEHSPLMASPTSVVGYTSLYDNHATVATAAPIAAYEVTQEREMGNETVSTDAADIAFLEARATDKQVLMSSDALHFILAQSPIVAERIEVLDMIIDVAKATYPAEDGWIVVNKARILSLLK